MIAVSERTACVPMIGEYHVIMEMLLERCLHCKILPCPPVTKRTVEIGSKNSPDMVCTPFKITIGNFIEAYEQGANLFIMPGSGCRLGLYDILQKQILTDLGYDIEMLTLFDYLANAGRLYKSLNGANPELTQEQFDNVLNILIRLVIDMDELADYMRKNMAFEINKGEFESNYREYIKLIRNMQSVDEAAELGMAYKEKLAKIKINKPENPIRIGIIGEMYAVMEPSSNCYLERWLVEHGVEIVRPIDLTRITKALFTIDEQIENSGGYVTYNIGSTANDSIAHAYKMVIGGIDGVIHIKPSTCSPEITAMSVLQNMSADFNVPIIYLTFDTETSEAGLHTRLEAFHDMLEMRRNHK